MDDLLATGCPMPITTVEDISTDLLLIGDRRVKGSGECVTLYYPGTGLPTREANLASADDVARAADCAVAAFPKWHSLPPAARRDMMLRAAQLLAERAKRLARIASLDTGLTISNVEGFVLHAAEWLRYYAGWIDKFQGHTVPMPAGTLDYVSYDPFGVVGVISPSNSTVSAMILAPLLAAGNCAIIKPSQYTAQVVAEYLQVFLDAGMPPGVVNSVPGGAEVGEALIDHPAVRKVHFTGSCDVGAKVAARASLRMKPSAMELEGKSANIVFADADLNRAAGVAMRAITRQAGQSCVAGTRVLVHESVAADLLARTVEMTRKTVIGMPLAAESVMGPVLSAQARDRIMGVIDEAHDNNYGRLALGGTRLDADFPGGYFIAPTIFADVDNASPIAQQETFGPVISFITFSTDEEAAAIANASDFGLAAYIHSADLRRVHKTAEMLEVGTIWANGAAGILPGTPFGGAKDSGWGRVGGWAGLSEFTRTKNIWVSYG
jgi:acyl-CoA reductase-like NAD-dependent aldehyde dehydrogenase